MKFAKLSIAAIAVVGFASSAVAGDKTDITFKPFAKTKIYYETDAIDGDSTSKGDLFSKAGASGGAMVSAGATGKLNSCFGYGFEAMAVDTLGLENNLVSNTRMGWDKRSNYNLVDTQFWAPQAYVTYHPCDVGTNTTFKIGRQYLDTPLAFTENWNIAPNSFDAAVVMNQDILNTTLVGAYVGKGNGVFGRVTNGNSFQEYGTNALTGGATALKGALNLTDDQVTGFAADNVGGAYAIGAITSLLDGAIPLSVWGYDVHDVANAFWADAGYKANLDGTKLDLGAQYGRIMPAGATEDALKAALGAADDSQGFGLKVGGNMNVADMGFGLTAAYSSMDDSGVIALANTATVKSHHGMVGGKKTKLYTAGIYNDGSVVAMPGSDAFKIKASTKLAGIGSLTAQYVSNDNSKNNALDVDEIDVIVGTSLPGGLGVKAIYINRDFGEDSVADHDHIRMILSKNF